jgi:hypothetical protein
MFFSAFRLRLLVKKCLGARVRNAGKREAHPRLEQLESRVNPSAPLVATSFFDSAVYEFDPASGALLSTLVASNSSALLSGPAGLAVGPDGNLYLSSQFNNSIAEYNLTSHSLSTFIPSSVLQPIATANGDAQFAPAGLQFGPDGNLYVSLNGGQSATSGGAVVRFGITVGGTGLAYSGTSTTVATGLIQPSGLTFGAAAGDTNSLYVSNSGADDVVKVTSATAATPASSVFIAHASGGMNFPSGLNWGSDGKLYVVDLGATSLQGNVLQFNADGSFSKIITPTGSGQPGNLQLQFPSSVVFDGQGHMLTANLGAANPPNLAGSINQYNIDGTFDQTLVASSQFPSTGTGTSGISPSQLVLLPAVSTGGFSKFTLSVAGGSTVVAGNSFLITAQATDQSGNPVSGSGVPTTITATASPADPRGNFPINAPVSNNGSAFMVGNLQTAGSYTITAGGSSTNVTVTPASANYFTVTAPASATTGAAFNVTVTAYDRFGNVATGYTGTVGISSSDPAASSVTPYHFVAADNGVHTFSVTLNSSTLASGFGTIIIAQDTTATSPPIAGFSPAITVQGLVVVPGGFVKTATGFTVTFSKPFTPADLTMYGLNTTTVQDVKMVGADLGNGAFTVAGTLFLDPTTPNTIVFKASNAYLEDTNVNNANTGGDKDSVALPDDTYVVTLKSGTGTNGLVDALGSHLDGASNGGTSDWTTTYATTFQDDAHGNVNPVPVLGIPDFARGPDSSTTIAVPILATGNNVPHGIPITLYNAAAVTDATFTLTYNPQILTPTAGGTGDATVAGSTFTMGTITSVDSTHSTVSFTYHNATAKSGTVILGDITATVPNSAATIYKTKELLALSGITVNGGATVQAADGIHVDAYVGDVHVTALPAIDASDALDANTIANAPHNSGFTAYGLLDPAIIGAFVPGNLVAVGPADVTALFSKAAHLPVPSLPAIPASVTTVNVNGADPTLSLVGAINANGIVSVAVMLDDPHPVGSTGMTEAHLALTYDPSVLSVSAADITLGSIPGAGWRITSEVNAATGTIGINLFNLEGTPITATQAGSLVNIEFHILPGAPVTATSVQLASQVTANGRRFVTEVDDDQGPLTLSPGVDRVDVALGWKRQTRVR